MQRPSFFISSTIYDFKDLRSALRYFLELQGCTVYASEFNDFPKSLDTDSYEACIQAIHKADYFILLIGHRIGGWYDQNKRISITQQEYREAYKLHKAGKLKILNFVRSEIWDLRDNFKELSHYLDNIEMEPGIRKEEVLKHSSKSVKDPRFIINFIK
ncbi:MAG: DUF4062 domain-containing protein [Saprospiraceae bacterium]|nr:DUF4062 domain-containing protein [Candidatus Opimibacter skivensis]